MICTAQFSFGDCKRVPVHLTDLLLHPEKTFVKWLKFTVYSRQSTWKIRKLANLANVPLTYFLYGCSILSLELPKDSKLLLSKATIIVCPASLVHQWHKEIEKRVNKLELKVHIYHGPQRETRPNRYIYFCVKGGRRTFT